MFVKQIRAISLGRCWDISLDKGNVWSAGGSRWKIRGTTKSVEFILWGSWMFVQKFMSIYQIVVEIFQFEPNWWLIDRQTGIAIHSVTLCMLAWLQTSDILYYCANKLIHFHTHFFESLNEALLICKLQKSWVACFSLTFVVWRANHQLASAFVMDRSSFMASILRPCRWQQR